MSLKTENRLAALERRLSELEEAVASMGKTAFGRLVEVPKEERCDGGAFNIPENKVKAAHDWQAQRGPLMQTPPHMRDRNFPPHVRHFRNWNAHSVFFWDPAGNILEYIGRHTLKNPAPGPFTSDDILYASEIAFVTDDVPTMASAIEQRFDLPQYLQGSAGTILGKLDDI